MIISGHEISFTSCYYYWGWVIIGTIVIKSLMAGVCTMEYKMARVHNRQHKKWGIFRYYIINKDYCVPTIVGSIELAIYPILISLGSWQAISAWIGLKTAAGWRWKENEDRQGYTNFLLGNALVIGAAFFLVFTIKT